MEGIRGERIRIRMRRKVGWRGRKREGVGGVE